MTFLEQYEALSTSGKSPDEVVLAQLGLLQEAVVKHPSEFFAELRVECPVFVTPFGTVVTHYRDVIEIIDLDEIFGVSLYGQAMTRNNPGPNFMLGLEDGPAFERELATLRTAVRQSDLDEIRAFVATAAQKVIDEAAGTGRLDLGEPFGHLVPTQMASWYFGVPVDDFGKLMTWSRAIFRDIFLNLTLDATVTAQAVSGAQEFRDHVDGILAAVHAGTDEPAISPVFEGNVLKRLVALQAGSDDALTDGEIQNNVIGCIVGVADNTVAAVANTVNLLLDRPDELAGAVQAARAGDTELVGRYVWEALRFHTPAPFLVRKSTRPHTLAKGTPRETVIPGGTVVFAANGSAMMDDSVVDDPESFKLERPSHHHLHFGWGLHECFGKHIAGVQLPELVKAVLALPGLRRAPGDEGQPLYDGPIATRFVVEFDPA